MFSRLAGISIWRRGVATIVAVTLATTIGCGDGNRASLSGKVTAEGAPVTEGTILIAPVGGGVKPVNVGVEPDGSFKAEGVAIGKNTISYTAPAAAYPEGFEAKPGDEPTRSKWEGYKTSTAEIDVKAGEQAVEIDLTK